MSSLLAHAAGPTVPDAGSILQQVQPSFAPRPAVSTDTVPLVTPPPTPSNPLPDQGSFVLQHIEIVGNTRIPTAELHALVANAEGQRVTLADVGRLAARITDYYHQRGYPLARAVVPPQTIQQGLLQIEVIEARYGAIDLHNTSRISDRLLYATLGGLQSGTVVAQSELDRHLLLLSDIPGITVHAQLSPGALPGTTNLNVSTAPSQPWVGGSVFFDNGGQRDTGIVRLGATLALTNPLHLGDVFDLSGMTTGHGLNYARASYEALLDGIGTRAGIAGAALDYRLGGDMAALDGYGNAQTVSAWVRQPLVRARAVNLFTQLQFDHMRLDDEIGATGTQTDRQLDLLSASLSGDERDGWLGAGVGAWSASWTYGHVGFDNALAAEADANGAQTQGSFSKFNLGLTRLQNFSGNNQLYLALTSQWASTNLDTSQQLLAGGSATVRAYSTSTIGGDSGYLFTAELRHTFAEPWGGQWQAIVFFDGAHVQIERHPVAAGPNIANLGGVGTGINWSGPDRINASLSVATPVGARPSELGSVSSVRVWAQATKAF